MTDCVRKLRQERGASVVFALVIFLIVTIFSWTMVNGALTAAQNASMQREEEQAYLSVTSAARLFCQQFQGDNTGKMLIGKFPSSVYFPEPPQQFKWSVYWNNTSFQLLWKGLQRKVQKFSQIYGNLQPFKALKLRLYF